MTETLIFIQVIAIEIQRLLDVYIEVINMNVTHPRTLVIEQPSYYNEC